MIDGAKRSAIASMLSQGYPYARGLTDAIVECAKTEMWAEIDAVRAKQDASQPQFDPKKLKEQILAKIRCEIRDDVRQIGLDAISEWFSPNSLLRLDMIRHFVLAMRPGNPIRNEITAEIAAEIISVKKEIWQEIKEELDALSERIDYSPSPLVDPGKLKPDVKPTPAPEPAKKTTDWGCPVSVCPRCRHTTMMEWGCTECGFPPQSRRERAAQPCVATAQATRDFHDVLDSAQNALDSV